MSPLVWSHGDLVVSKKRIPQNLVTDYHFDFLKLAFWGSRFCELNPDINTTDLLVIYVGPSIPHICWCYIR